MVTGVLFGAAMGMWLSPQIDGDPRGAVMSATRDLANRAERVFKRGRSEMEDVMR